jgi:hypothetical protein
MTPQKQLNRHRPDEGIYGDCTRTVLACLLDVDRDTVPHFNDGVWEPEVKDAWLRERDLRSVHVLYPGDLHPDEVIAAVSAMNPGLYWQLSGESRTGVNHVVICKDGAVEWDTSLNDSGIIGPCDDGYYWVEFLTPLAQAEYAGASS